MSTQRLSMAPALMDRLFSNSPDPVQSSILRDSAKGWGKSSSPNSNSGTTPLRIAKREGKPPFPPVARRSSSSYKHVRNSNLVSNSPFKTQPLVPPRPSTSSDTQTAQQPTRRVSGEKRPRPDSMHEQAENERPLAFKRERRQSKAYQGLIEKEPVTKSPFKRVVSTEEEQPPPVPPKAVLTPAPPPSAPPSPPPSAPPSRPITPSRSSLVSKRLHGPRAADHPSLDGRRQRRKTVTFDERCDVLEFDRDEEEEENPFFSSDEDDYGEPEQRGDFDAHHSQRDDGMGGNSLAQFENVQSVDADESITGIVDRMIQSASLPGLGFPSTPPRHPSLPADMETEDGVPYGRSHHAERARRRASVSSPALATPEFPFHDSDQDALDSPSTPPRTAESSMELSSGLEIPLGRSTHVERARQDHQVDEVEADVNMMPPSPSPAKVPARSEHSNRDSLVPRFELQPPRDESSPKNSHRTLSTADPFSASLAKEDVAELSFSSFDDPALDPGNLSIGQSEVSLSNVDLEAELQKAFNPPQPDANDNVPRLSDLIPPNASFSTSTPPLTPPLSFARSASPNISGDQRAAHRESVPSPHAPSQSRASPLPVPPVGVTSHSASPSTLALPPSSGSPTGFNMRRRSDSPLTVSSRFSSSPALRSASPSLWTGSPLREIASAQELQGGSPPKTRISKEDVHMRLRRKRSMESPLGSPAPGSPAPPVEPTAPETEVGMTTAELGDAPPEGGKSAGEAERRLDITGAMDISAELATIQTAEKRTMNSITVNTSGQEDLEQDTMREDPLLAAADDSSLSARPSTVDPVQPQPRSARPQSSFSMLETSFDLSGSLGVGLRESVGSIQLGEMRSALDRLMDDVKGNSSPSTNKSSALPPARAELATDGKAGHLSPNTSSNVGDESVQTETDMDLSMDDYRHAPIGQSAVTAPLPIQRAATDSIVYTAPSFRSPVEEQPAPISPTKDAIRAREQLILEKRREARRRDREVSVDYYTPPRPTSMPSGSSGCRSRRRSRSTGALTKSELLLDVGLSDTEEELLADSISRELRRLDPELRQGNYRVREHEAIFASADAEQVSHTSFAGDVNSGKAWKAVRRPSDMNEYAKQIKEYRSQEKPGKAHGKVFVRVLGVRGLKVPVPQQTTALTCTLNNGIHFVTTPETRLSSEARIDQEFELIEHNKLEFTLTLKVRRDPHIVTQFKALVPPPPPPTPVPQLPPPPPKQKSGMFSFLSSSPKKQPVSRATPPPPPPPPHKLPDNLARYLKQDGTLARAFISFKDIAARCDVRLLEVNYPLIGQRIEASGNATTMELGEIVLQIFRLPSLPGVSSSQLPLSLDECLRGLRHVAWHKVTYFEGTLTQNGGDCASWRRRMFRVTGANLIAFNDVTKKATATINLKKAIAVEDTHDARSAAPSLDGRHRDDFDSLISVERSFRLVFPSEQEILFFADSDEEKARWLEVLRALVGHIPPNSLWAELVWQRQQEMSALSHPSGSAS